MFKEKLTREEALIAMLLFSYPILLLIIKGGMNALFFLLVITSLFTLYRQRRELQQLMDRQAIVFSLAMSSSIVALFLSQAYHGNFTSQPYDAASKFLLVIPLYLLLRNASIRTVSWLQYGLPLGIIATLLSVLHMKGVYAYSGRASTAFLHPIYFGDLALMLGLLSLFSINWLEQDRSWLVTLKAAGFLAGVYISVLSQSRGGWIAIPVLLFVWLVLQNKKRQLIKLSYAIPLIILALLASYFFVNIVHQRIDWILNDIAEFSKGHTDTSVGQRFQLWKAALYLYGNNPIFGVGPGGFADAMTTLSQAGIITEDAARLGRGEVHNQILSSLVALGIPGLLSVLSVYFVPLYLFWKSTGSNNNIKRTAGMMGVCLTLGFFIFGLTVETFNIKMLVAFYSLTLATLLAAATHKD